MPFKTIFSIMEKQPMEKKSKVWGTIIICSLLMTVLINSYNILQQGLTDFLLESMCAWFLMVIAKNIELAVFLKIVCFFRKNKIPFSVLINKTYIPMLIFVFIQHVLFGLKLALPSYSEIMPHITNIIIICMLIWLSINVYYLITSEFGEKKVPGIIISVIYAIASKCQIFTLTVAILFDIISPFGSAVRFLT